MPRHRNFDGLAMDTAAKTCSLVLGTLLILKIGQKYSLSWQTLKNTAKSFMPRHRNFDGLAMDTAAKTCSLVLGTLLILKIGP